MQEGLCISQSQAWPSPGRLLGIRTFSLPEGWVFVQLSLPGGSGFWIWEIFYGFEIKMQEFLDFFQRNWRQLEKQAFLCCFMSVFAKVVDVYCVFYNIDHFWPFRSFYNIQGSLCLCRSSLKFECLTSQGLSRRANKGGKIQKRGWNKSREIAV